MNNLKTVILLVIIFIIGVSAIYWVYQSQISKTQEELLPLPSPGTTFDEIASPSPISGVGEVKNDQSYIPKIQPEAGSNTLEVKNIGIQVSSPNASSIISSPVIVAGIANVIEGIVNINITDANGNVLGSKSATACMGNDACPFKASIEFSSPSTSTGAIQIYSPSAIDGSANYLQTILVRF